MLPPDFARRKRRDQEQWLAEELRRQGLAERPPFSPALYERIRCELVCQPRGDTAGMRGLWLVRAGPTWIAAAAVIAACAVGLALVLWQRGAAPGVPVPAPLAHQQPTLPPPPQPLELPRVARVAPDVNDLPALVQLAAGPRWAWLDHDARLTFETLAGQLPRDLAAAWSGPGPEKTP